ncbi:hypothetical protein LINGRAHAP2_LOCUS36941, partial [Linum grandiflorum]
KIAAPLVCIFPNSATLPLAGIWNSNPGVRSTNSTVAITTGPQSAIFRLVFLSECKFQNLVYRSGAAGDWCGEWCGFNVIIGSSARGVVLGESAPGS